MRPEMKTSKDYLEIKHVTSYEPIIRYEAKIDYVPVERIESVDSYPHRYSYIPPPIIDIEYPYYVPSYLRPYSYYPYRYPLYSRYPYYASYYY